MKFVARCGPPTPRVCLTATLVEFNDFVDSDPYNDQNQPVHCDVPKFNAD